MGSAGDYNAEVLCKKKAYNHISSSRNDFRFGGTCTAAFFRKQYRFCTSAESVQHNGFADSGNSRSNNDGRNKIFILDYIQKPSQGKPQEGNMFRNIP